MHRTNRRSTALALTALLAACTGSKPGPAPVALAGPDQEAWKGAVVTLDGSASSGGGGLGLSYAWRQVSGEAVALSDDHGARTTFTAPRRAGALRFSLTVTAGGSRSVADEVLVLVRNRAPRADAGPDLVVAAGQLATLDATRSADPDGDALSAEWFQRSGPPVALTPHADGSATFVAPGAGATLEFGLIVSDGDAPSEVSPVTVLVYDQGANWPPLAMAGADQDVPRRAVVHLSGGATDREGDPVAFAWVQVAGPAVALLGADGPAPSFVAPAEEADLEFQLVVGDATGTASDRVLVRVRNRAPVLTGPVLSPAAPVTTDPLVASAQATDADQDPVALTFAWRRNGELLADATGPALPASLTTKGDVFVVTVTASDGVLSSGATASVTIQDAPPVLRLSAPATATWGQPYAFSVTADDPDGDPIGRVVLLHGPAGMTVSEAGQGTWVPTPPMFGEALDVAFAVGAAGLPGDAAAAVVQVQDPGRKEPLRRTGIEVPVRQNGLVAADLDGDGAAELLVASRSGLFELAFDGAGYAQRWAYPFAPGAASLTAVAARDLDGDARPEIFLATPVSSGGLGALLRLDGATRRVVASLPQGCADLEVADLDGDGAAEVACLRAVPWSSPATGTVVALDAASLQPRWQSAELALGYDLAVGDVDGDGAPEVVTSGGLVLAGASGAVEWSYGAAFGAAVDTGDLDGDGAEEIVGMDDWNRFRGFSAVLKAPIWEQATFDNDALLVADVDRDGTPEVVVGDGQWGDVTAYRYRKATNDLEATFRLDSQDHGVTSLAAGDLDGDGAPELAWGTGASHSGADVFVVAALGPPAAVEWKGFSPSQLDGPFLGAVPARTSLGQPPALLFFVPRTDSGYAGARLVRLDPATGRLSMTPELGTNWSGGGALDAFDFDGDGLDEALVATAGFYDGYLAAWDFAAGAVTWTSPPDIGSGRAMAHADLNGDGAQDLLVLTNEGYVLAYDLRAGARLWKSTGLGGGVDLAAGDLDLDGTPEIVVLTGSRLVLLRRAPAGGTWLESAAVAVQGYDLALADSDGDRTPELFVLTGPYAGSASGVSRFDASLAPLGSFALSGDATSLSVEDLGPGRKNLLVGRGDSWIYSGAPSFLEAVDPGTGARVWRSPPLWGTVGPNSLRYVELDGDGFLELAFGTSSGMYLTAPPP